MRSSDLLQAKRALARFTAALDAIFAQKRADATNPAHAKLRAINAKREAERRAEYDEIIRGGLAISARSKIQRDAKRCAAVEGRRKELAR